MNWEFTDSIPGSFTYVNAAAYYTNAYHICIRNLMPRFVEVGVDQGRSSSVILQAMNDAMCKGLLILVDSWESVLADNKERVVKLANQFVNRTIILHKKSVDAASNVTDKSVHMLLIDADHTKPDEDCKLWLPKLKPGGIACFHDYDSSWVKVKPAVDEYTSHWENLGDWDGLAVRRKP